MKCIDLLAFFSLFLVIILPQWASAQLITPENSVNYTKENRYIKEFPVPLQETGLKGITTDLQGNAWFYYSTNQSTTIFKFNPAIQKFTRFDSSGQTVVDNAIINLAGGQLAFDKNNTLWFTDARTNSIGKLTNGKVQLIPIPTQKSGPLGIVVSPYSKQIWFAEITGDKIANLDTDIGKITEYSTGQDSGPALLTFDSRGVLWVTLAYSRTIMQVQPWLLTGVAGAGMTSLSLPNADTFSPFGIGLLKDKLYLSDHGSSRVIASDTGLANYISYWTSPSDVYPETLPSQIVTSEDGNNVYFPEHGGNRIAKIGASGMLTEYEIPTGPLSAAVFIGVSDSKVWFTEWASNKIAYLDTTVPVPFSISVNTNQITIDNGNAKSLQFFLDNKTADITVVGMTESGLHGVRYHIENNNTIGFNIDNNAKSGVYTIMVRASDGTVSTMFPVQLTVNATTVPITINTNSQIQSPSQGYSLQDFIRIGALSVAVGLVGFLIYSRVRRSRNRQNITKDKF